MMKSKSEIRERLEQKIAHLKTIPWPYSEKADGSTVTTRIVLSTMISELEWVLGESGSELGVGPEDGK